MHLIHTRREWLLRTTSGVAGASLLRGAAPSRPVAIAKCKTYEPSTLVPALSKLFDQLGGLGRLVNGKTVAIKINLTGAPTYRLGTYPLEDTHYTHPNVIAATVHLMDKAGARRIRLLESPWATADPVEEYILQANWEPRELLTAGRNVGFVNTNFLGKFKHYSRFNVPYGGYLFPAYDLNQAYENCDVFVSLAKMKEHATTGITLSMKNCFGMTPATIYGTGAGADEPSEMPKGGRALIHSGFRQPSKSSPSEKDPKSSRQEGYRVPRAVVDLVTARPIHLAVVEGIKTMTGGEGPWIREALTCVNPGVIVAGTNPVNTDAVCMAVMNFDPMGDRGTPPFETADSMLRLAEDVGLGTRDLSRIELAGSPIKDVMFDFAALRKQRRAAAAPPMVRRG